MSESLGAECAHGALARSCPRCEDAATIAELLARLSAAQIAGEAAADRSAKHATERDRAVSLLRRLEWAGRSLPGGHPYCPTCLSFEGNGGVHAPGCEIAEVLR